MQLRSASVRPGRGQVRQVDAEAVGHRQARPFADQDDHASAPPSPAAMWSPSATRAWVAITGGASEYSPSQRGDQGRQQPDAVVDQCPRGQPVGQHEADVVLAAGRSSDRSLRQRGRGRAGAGTRCGCRPGWSTTTGVTQAQLGDPAATNASTSSGSCTASRAAACAALNSSTRRVGSASPARPSPIRAWVVSRSRSQKSPCTTSLDPARDRRSLVQHRSRSPSSRARQLPQRRGSRVDRQHPAGCVGHSQSLQPALELRGRAADPSTCRTYSTSWNDRLW